VISVIIEKPENSLIHKILGEILLPVQRER
jgi:hypothetical protein